MDSIWTMIYDGLVPTIPIRVKCLFYTGFKMVRPDGSSLHEHFIKNFKSTNVLVEKEKIIVDGIADIYSGKSLDYREIPSCCLPK